MRIIMDAINAHTVGVGEVKDKRNIREDDVGVVNAVFVLVFEITGEETFGVTEKGVQEEKTAICDINVDAFVQGNVIVSDMAFFVDIVRDGKASLV